MPGEPAKTILDGRWCVPNCKEGGTYQISNQTCTYPNNFGNFSGSSGVISVDNCGKSMISSKSLSNFDYPTSSSCAPDVEIITLFKRYLVSSTPNAGYRFIYIDEL